MAKKGGAKDKLLRQFITEFAIEIDYKADKDKYNKAWHKLWCRIARIELFKKEIK